MKHLSILAGLLLTVGALAMEPNAELEQSIWNTSVGNTLYIGKITTQHNFMNFTVKDSGPRIVFSDNPEYLKDEGICCSETLGEETARVYLYNVNDSPTNHYKFAIILKNLTNKPGKVTIYRRAAIKPSQAYGRIGKVGLLDFYSKPYRKTVQIPAKGSALLDDFWEKNPAARQDLAHGFYEIYSHQSTQIIMAGMVKTKNTLKTYSQLTLLPPNNRNAGRGIFVTSDRYVKTSPIDTKNGIQRLRMADGQIDKWVKGYDSSVNVKTENIGNYGVLYTVEVPYTSSDNRLMAVVVMSQPAGADYCSYGGVVGTKAENNLTKAGYYLTPADQYHLVEATKGCLVGLYQAQPKGGTIQFEFSPPGSSCLPADFFFIPVNSLNK